MPKYLLQRITAGVLTTEAFRLAQQQPGIAVVDFVDDKLIVRGSATAIAELMKNLTGWKATRAHKKTP